MTPWANCNLCDLRGRCGCVKIWADAESEGSSGGPKATRFCFPSGKKCGAMPQTSPVPLKTSNRVSQGLSFSSLFAPSTFHALQPRQGDVRGAPPPLIDNKKGFVAMDQSGLRVSDQSAFSLASRGIPAFVPSILPLRASCFFGRACVLISS